MKPKVSWLMPVFNAEKYLRRSIDSMLVQSVQDFEVIIVMEPDCKDHTENICREYAEKDDRIRIIKNETRLGIAKSLNIGLENARGKYIARMDADDYSHPKRLEKQIAYMDTHREIGILCTNRRVICDNGDTYQSDHPTDPEEISARLLFGFCLNHPSMMLRAELFRENGWKYPIDREAEDFGLCAELVKYTKIGCLKEVLIDYYEHGDNAIYSKFDDVRKASAWISREAIKTRLGIENVDLYEDIYFGWRELDYPLEGIENYLKKGYRLFREIYLANEEKKVIDTEIFYKEINRQWKITIDISGLGFLMPNTDFPELIKSDNLDFEIDVATKKFYDVFSCEKKFAIWGTGDHCRKIMEGLDGNYPFRLCVFVDSDPHKDGSSFFGIPVIAPEKLRDIQCDYVAIASHLYKDEIYSKMVKEIGFPAENILILPQVGLLRVMADKYKCIHTSFNRQAYLFMSPDYGNLGDHAIAEAEKDFLEDLDYCVHEIPADDFTKYAYITQCTRRSGELIVITGGGFLGSLWYEHHRKVEQIVQIHPNNPVIIFPQTLFWDKTIDEDKIERSINIFNSHKDLTLCARDFVSYIEMKRYYPKCKIILAPDMVLYKKWSEYFRGVERNRGAIICLKDDKESRLSEEDKKKIEELAVKYCGEAVHCNMDKKIKIEGQEREKYLMEILSQFRRAQLIVTDRLHGMLFAAITETPCVVTGNCNHKVRATFEWIRDLTYIKYAYDPEMIGLFIPEVLDKRGVFQFDKSNFFQDLSQTVKAVIQGGKSDERN